MTNLPTYFHITNNPDCTWSPGDEIQFGLEDNNMWRLMSGIGDYIELNGVSYSADVIVLHALDEYARVSPPPLFMCNYHFNPIITLKESTDSLGNLMRVNRELIFESVRREFYPELPSRHTCVWLIPNDEGSLNFWKNKLHTPNQRIFKVSADGKVHRAAEKWLIGGTIPVTELISKAHNYWKGVDSGSHEDEIIFVGKMKILEEIIQ